MDSPVSSSDMYFLEGSEELKKARSAYYELSPERLLEGWALQKSSITVSLSATRRMKKRSHMEMTRPEPSTILSALIGSYRKPSLLKPISTLLTIGID